MGNEASYLFDKSYECPVCDASFHSKTVKAGKARFLASDSDLRPKHYGIDVLKYDVIVCPHCGYAAVSRFFPYITERQAELIKENITKAFEPMKQQPSEFTYNEAIKRHKLALMNAIVSGKKESEKAYTCLKIAWLYRGFRESMEHTDDKEAVLANLEHSESEYLKKAYVGLYQALMKEQLPICGMDEGTCMYLVAELARETGQYEEALRILSQLLVKRNISERLKDRIRIAKDKIKEVYDEIE